MNNATVRTFKTAWFVKAARKARISDDELCEAIQEVMKGQAAEQEHAQEHHPREVRQLLAVSISVRQEGQGQYRR
ncbi:type II toxin-antitoxin system RelE/ParE family toxin [Novosphingobium sp. Rr 2-17]|uniref:type II toxin-antitoxin system RelE/ParE family toxin n=1 Tax=Novosphingobium sp. Rr 2-17 TaxID=555793 RepID=UPI00192B5FFA